MTKFADYIKAGELYDPVRGTLPSSLVTSDVIANSRLAFTSEAEYRWNDVDFKFNNIGQKWRADVRPTFSGPDTYGGVKNCGSPRRYSAQAAGMVNQFFASTQEFEILFTGNRFSVIFMNLGGDNTGGQFGGECTIWVEYGGGMWRLADSPKISTRTDGFHSYRNVVFAQTLINKRIRFRFSTAGFNTLATDGSSIVSPAPVRPMSPLDGDSWVESTQALTADAGVTQYYSTGIAYYLFEGSGWNIPERGQGATGFFSNGASFVTDDTVGTASSYILFIQITITGLSRWFSGGGTANLNSRQGWLSHAAATLAANGYSPFVNYAGEDFAQPLGRRPSSMWIFGTWNDASVGGVSFEVMYARAKACYEALHALDPYCQFIHVSPEPFNDGLFGNAIGAPRRGDKSHIHVMAQMKAASEVPNIHYINAFGPEDPWWTGMGPANGGTNGVPANSQQAKIVSKNDGIHYGREGGKYTTARILNETAEIPLYLPRVLGKV